jgi:hypothetical protein
MCDKGLDSKVAISRDTRLCTASYLRTGMDLVCNLAEVTLVQMQESASGMRPRWYALNKTVLMVRKYSDGSDYGTVSIR